jgi:hypothetical protein
MASEILKKALGGDERALVIMTEHIQEGAITAEDMAELLKTQSKSNDYSDYLKACIYACGPQVGEFKIAQDKARAVSLCLRLISEKKSSWANNLMYELSTAEDRLQKYLVPAIDRDNILALFNYFMKAGERGEDSLPTLTAIYARLSAKKQSEMNRELRGFIDNAPLNLLQRHWSAIHQFYQKTGQHEEGSLVLVKAAKNNIIEARRKLAKRYDSKSSVEYFCSGFSSTLSVIIRKMALGYQSLENAYPKIYLSNGVDFGELPVLEKMAQTLLDVMRTDVRYLTENSPGYRQYELAMKYYELLNFIGYIREKSEEWTLFKNYIENNPQLLNAKTVHNILRVDKQFESFFEMCENALKKMQAVGQNEFGMLLCTLKELDEIHLRLLLIRLTETLTRQKEQSSQLLGQEKEAAIRLPGKEVNTHRQQEAPGSRVEAF